MFVEMRVRSRQQRRPTKDAKIFVLRPFGFLIGKSHDDHAGNIMAFTNLHSYHVNQMGCHVDFDLTKADLQALLEVAEKLTVFNEVLDVDDDPH